MNNLEVQLASLQVVVAYLLRRDSDRSGTPVSAMHHTLCAALAETTKRLELRGDFDARALQENEAAMSAAFDRLFFMASRMKSTES